MMNQTPEITNDDRISRIVRTIMTAAVLIWIGCMLLFENLGWLSGLAARLPRSAQIDEILSDGWRLAVGGAGIIFLVGGIGQILIRGSRKHILAPFILAIVSLKAGNWIPLSNGVLIPVVLIGMGVYVIIRVARQEST